jgi:hypothetical protein
MFKHFKSPSNDQFSSNLFDQDSFYPAFLKDLRNCSKELVIESPFITESRMRQLYPVLAKLIRRGAKVYINTRYPDEHDATYEAQAYAAIGSLQELGAVVLYTAKHHRKLAIIDRQVSWEGSLNILSYSNSCEIMRRMASASIAKELIGFIKLTTYTGGTI